MLFDIVATVDNVGVTDVTDTVGSADFVDIC